MKKLVITTLITLKAISLSALDIPADITLSTSKLEGHTTYQIGNQELFPFSELKFNVNSTLANIAIRFPEVQDYSLTAVFSTTIQTDSYNQLVDKDWLSPGSLDIISEGATDLNAFQVDIVGEKMIMENENMKVYAGLGYNFQHFNLMASDLSQWYPSGNIPRLNSFRVNTVHTVAGNYIEYHANYHIPFAQLKGVFNMNSIQIELTGRFSPVAILYDYDNHLLRKKDMTSIGFGNHFGLDAKLSYTLRPDLKLFALGSYKVTETHGIQTQRFYGTTREATEGTTFEVDHKGFSEQFSISAGVTYSI